MKSKLLLLSFLMFLTVATNYAQITASQAGIAVQGIARDNNNTALTSDQQITLQFKIYYAGEDGDEKSAFEEVVPVSLDAFGVFSHVLDVDAIEGINFANYEMKLFIGAQIGNDFVKISDEPLHYVPFAISANNGVPTGSIMPYIGRTGADLPKGWVLCDGQSLPTTAKKLIAIIGNNAPDLRGMFLRGTGISPVNNQAGPALNKPQGEGIKSHQHDKGTIAASGGEHKHVYMDKWRKGMGDDQGDDQDQLDNDFRHQDEERTTPNLDGGHTHTITGITGPTGIEETRPVSHGVNYIIKL